MAKKRKTGSRAEVAVLTVDPRRNVRGSGGPESAQFGREAGFMHGRFGWGWSSWRRWCVWA